MAMKWIAAMATLIGIGLLISLGSGWTDTPGLGEEVGIQVVAGVARWPAIPPGAGPVMPAPEATPEPMIALPPRPEESVVTRTDAEALDVLFDTQVRDPTWAPGAEADIKSHLPADAEARCAEFMCRIAMPLPDRSTAKSADQEADAASRHWSTGLSYNRLTATIVGDRSTPRLIFYVTRSAGGDQITS